MALWYVRPNTSHSGTRDGTAYATAWGGLSAIVWGGAGVVAGDTLYLCGAFSESSNFTIGTHGATAGSRVEIRGDATEEAGTLTFTAAVRLVMARSYTTLRGLTINANSASACVYQNNANAGCEYYDNDLIGGTYGIFCSLEHVHTSVIIDGNRIRGQSLSGIRYSPTSASSVFGPFTITNNDIREVAVGGTVNGEPIRLSIEAPGYDTSTWASLVVNDNTMEDCGGHAPMLRSGDASSVLVTPLVYSPYAEVKRNIVKRNGRVAGDAGNHGGISVTGFTRAVIDRNTVHDCYVTGAGVQTQKNVYALITRNDIRRIRSGAPTSVWSGGFPIDGNGIFFDTLTLGGLAWGNYIKDLVNTGAANSGVALAFYIAKNCEFRANVAVNCANGAAYGHADDEGNKLTRNTFVNCDIGVRKSSVTASAGDLTARNNLFIDCAIGYSLAANPSIDEDYSFIYGATTAYSGITAGAESVVEALPAVAKLSTDYRPLADSALIGAGVHLGYSTDADGVQCFNPPTIGAYEPPRARSAASARNPRV